MGTIRSAMWIDSTTGLPLSSPTSTPEYQVIDDTGAQTVAAGTATTQLGTTGNYRTNSFTAVVGRIYTIIFDGDPNGDNNVTVGDRFKSTVVDGDEEIANAAIIAATALTAQEVRDAMKLAPTAGAPAAGSVDEHLDEIAADAAEFNDTKITTARADNLDEITALRLAELDAGNLPADVASRASQTSVDDIQNTTRFAVSIPTLLVPSTGSTVFDIYVNLEDTNGNPEDPDAGITVDVTDQGGASRTANLDSTSMSNIAVGRWRVRYTVADTHLLEQLIFRFTYDENSVSFTKDRTVTVVDQIGTGFTVADRADLAAVLVDTNSLNDTKITTARANNLDEITALRLAELDAANLPADVDSILQAVVSATGTVAAGSTSTNVRTTISLPNDRPNNLQVLFFDGTVFVSRNVNDYLNANGEFVVDDLGFTPGTGSSVILLARTGSTPVDLSTVTTALDDIKGAGFVSGTDSLRAIRVLGGAGPWTTATGFATPTNVTDARDAVITQGDSAWTTATGFAVPGSAMTLTTGERTAIATEIWGTDLTGFIGLVSAGHMVNAMRQFMFNRLEASPSGSGTLTLYLDNGTSPRGTYTIRDFSGGAIVGVTGVQARRGAFS